MLTAFSGPVRNSSMQICQRPSCTWFIFQNLPRKLKKMSLGYGGTIVWFTPPGGGVLDDQNSKGCGEQDSGQVLHIVVNTLPGFIYIHLHGTWRLDMDRWFLTPSVRLDCTYTSRVEACLYSKCWVPSSLIPSKDHLSIYLCSLEVHIPVNA